ncbi:hypothetical protein SO802_016637 [Lithocarpus litseifolius]|uniref:RNase H type-1 domain-containing protein n=1 Tax=Lithocarpus litseifolius TaxID=425828 RepID=A0AAW2D2G2_9ROSI
MAVSELIDPELHAWKCELIMNLFHRDDAAAITKILLSKRAVSNSLIWMHNKNGMFSVKEAESVFHALWGCAAMQDVWAGSISKLQKGVSEFNDFMQLMEYLVDRLSTEEVELFWVQCWQIWNQRNRILYGGQLKHPTSLNKRAEEFLEEFKHSQVSLDSSLLEQLIGDSWQPPPAMEYKLNFDAAIFSGLEKFGIGAIIRNDKGEVMAGMSAIGPKVDTSEEAELLACRRSIEFAVDAGFTRLVIEGDNFNVMHAISSDVANYSFLGNVVDDIRHLMSGLQ